MNTSPIKTTGTIRDTFVCALIAMTLAGTVRLTAGPVKEGDDFPDLKAARLEGKVPDTSGKVVLVDFFASWCGPCKESFPVMQELQEKFGDKGLVIVAVNLDKKESDMRDFLANHKVTFSVVRDGENALVKKVMISTMPSSFILDRTGKVRFVHRGFKGNKTKDEYLEQISELLK